MKSRLGLPAICCLLSVASAQWLETVIQLPDSTEPVAMCYSLPTDKVYCANRLDSSITVISGQTNDIIGTIPLGFAPGYFGLFAHPTAAKVYCGGGPYPIAVVDALADTVIRLLADTASLYRCCYNPTTNKLYCASRGFTVFDTGPDTVVGRIELENSYSKRMLCNPVTNRVYSVELFRDEVVVIDGVADTVCGGVSVGAYPNDGCWDAQLNRLFVSCEYPEHESSLYYIACTTNSVIQRVSVRHGPTGLAYNQAAQLLYVEDYYRGRVDAYRGTTGTHVTGRYIRPHSGTLFYNKVSDKLYCYVNDGNRIEALDGTTLQPVATVETDSFPFPHAWNPSMNRTYSAFGSRNRIAVIRDSQSGLQEDSSEEELPSSGATIARGVLKLPQDVGAGHLKPTLLDISGRRVTVLSPGANDVTHLTPGVYFVRGEDSRDRGFKGSMVTKVLVAR
ncbi:hypothetical protein JXD38_06855 [candidate division WOR-3 bacterium]|nr:hypothetical protein [candidate division WOR-3 bacterium]